MGLVRGTYQINIFEDTQEMLGLYQALEKMKNRYGFHAVGRADAILKTTVIPAKAGTHNS
jgi:DNA polymerase-4